MKEKIYKKLLIGLLVAVTLIIIIIFAPSWIKSGNHSFDVTITDMFTTQSLCGEGKIVFLNLTFENKKDNVATINNPVIITDDGRELYCDFINAEEGIDFSSGSLEVPENKKINATIKTWDVEYDCECLYLDEKPMFFKYSIGSGIVFEPKIFKVRIPEELIME